MTDAGLEIKSSIVDGIRVLNVIGEVDMATAPKLRTVVETFLNRPRRVVVDLSAVDFLDSSGLNALVHAQRSLAKREIGFRVVSPADQNVRQVFEITQMVETLGVVESLAEALA